MNIKDLYTYNKKTFWIIISIIIVITLVIFIFLNNKSNNNNINNPVVEDKYNLILFGDLDITLTQGEEYIEPGYYSILNGSITTDDVIVDNSLDINTIGNYTITYKYKDLVKTRNISIIEKEKEKNEDNKLDIILNGDKNITLKVNESYKELGAKAYFNDLDVSDNIVISGDVNTSKVGTYKIMYSITYNDLSIEKTRIVEVKEDLNLLIEYDNSYTNKNVNLNIKVSGSDFLYIKYPNNVVSLDSKTSYTVDKNGEYVFYAYDKNNQYVSKTINITNIDKTKPTGSCVSKYSNNQTVVTVTSNDNIGISHYLYNNTKSTNSKYIFNSKISKITVDIYDVAGNSNKITCNTSGITTQTNKNSKIEMHFMVTGHDDDAILIRTDDKVIMIDGGRYEDKKYVIPYLQDLGITKIDAMIGSHVHYNHVQAQAAILDNFKVSHAYYSVDIFNCDTKKNSDGYYGCKSNDNDYIADKLKSKKTPTTILKAGDYLKIGDMKLYFIGPIRGKLTTYQNANSLVFILEYKGKKFMFTGDTPDKYMTTSKFNSYASKFNINLNIDVLKWPHHGYETLTDEFFKATKPKYAIIPNCCSCSSKYPSSTNKSLMSKYGTKYYQICNSKNIVLVSDGKTITIKTNQKASNYKR